MKYSAPFFACLKKVLIAALLFELCINSAAWAGDWKLKDRDGNHFTLSDLRGKWVLINFWAPWCSPCLTEIPELNALHQQRKEMQIIGITVMYSSRKEVLEKINKYAVAFPVVFGNEDTAADFGGLDGLPTSILYSPDGKLIGQHQGELTQGDIERILDGKIEAAALFIPQ